MPLGLFETLLVQPLLTILDSVFSFWRARAPGLGLALIAFSLTINLLLSPIYAEMERSEAAQSTRRAKIRREVERMRKYFRGREQYFYIRTIHRHYGYSPLLAVLGSGSLLLQMLVFFTAYRYLRDQPVLAGVAFGKIGSLSEPDRLLWGCNLLPVLMTAINIVSAFLHSAERAQRLQAVGLAILFLVLLYASPSALLLYWTTNNAISLLRNLGRRVWARVRPPGWRGGLPALAALE